MLHGILIWKPKTKSVGVKNWVWLNWMKEKNSRFFIAMIDFKGTIKGAFLINWKTINNIGSVGLRRRYINITNTILDISHLPAFCAKHDISETAFYPRLLEEPTQLGPIDRAIGAVTGLRRQTSSIHWTQLSRLHLKRGQNPVIGTSWFQLKTGRWVMSKIIVSYSRLITFVA
jgi:hypothetical protein